MKVTLTFILGLLLTVSGLVYLNRPQYPYFFLATGVVLLCSSAYWWFIELRNKKQLQSAVSTEDEDFEYLYFAIDPEQMEIRPYTATYENEHYDDSMANVNNLGVLYGFNWFNADNDVLSRQYDKQPGVIIAFEQEIMGHKIRFREFIPVDEITFKMRLYTAGSGLHVRWKSQEAYQYRFELHSVN